MLWREWDIWCSCCTSSSKVFPLLRLWSARGNSFHIEFLLPDFDINGNWNFWIDNFYFIPLYNVFFRYRSMTEDDRIKVSFWITECWWVEVVSWIGLRSIFCLVWRNVLWLNAWWKLLWDSYMRYVIENDKGEFKVLSAYGVGICITKVVNA